MKDEEPVRWLSLFAACIVGSVALATDERGLGGSVAIVDSGRKELRR